MRTCALLLLGVLLLVPASPAFGQDIGAEPHFGDLHLEESFWPDPASVSLLAGGSVDVDIGGCAYGHTSSAPDVDLYYTTSGASNLYIYAEGDDDITLLINTPDGQWVCDDDGHVGLDPLVALTGARSGLYNIWVGSYGDEYHDATLYVSEIRPSGSSSPEGGGSASLTLDRTGTADFSGTPDLSLPPTYGNVDLDAGFLPDPHTVSVTAGGGVDVDVDSCGYGYVADAPDLDLYYKTSGSNDLYIYAESDGDTMLLVNEPDTDWLCDDDGHTGLDPVVVIPGAARGLYNIWVGSYGDEMIDATLRISEIDPR